jgi:hypothetical protein
MTEAEWDRCSDPQAMLAFLRGKASDRELRLFACACYRRQWDSLPDAHAREAAERYADGLVTREELKAARVGSHPAAWHLTGKSGGVAAWDVVEDAFLDLAWDRRALEGLAPLADLLRDIIGNPFEPVSLAPAWLAWNDGTVRKLAEAVYQERRFGDLPVVADALEDAGCTDRDILNHLRGPGPHVRGCWVVDLLLGRE